MEAEKSEGLYYIFLPYLYGLFCVASALTPRTSSRTLSRVKPFEAIAAMSLNRVIGAGNRIPWHLPEDFKWFKRITTGQVIVMGRKTFESIGRPLPNRTTLVLTRSSSSIPGVQTVPDLNKLMAEAAAFTGKKIFICGGAEVYRQALPMCSDLYLTVVNRVVEGDTFFPPFEERFELAELVVETAEFRILHYRARP
jgi:dihydrofolate reductase